MQDDKRRKGTELAERLASYAGDVLALCAKLPNTKEGRHVRDQLLRSGTAPGAHYAEARGAQSTADFLHKVTLATKEARESLHWLLSGARARLFGEDVSAIAGAGDRIVATLAAAQRTTRQNLDSRSS